MNKRRQCSPTTKLASKKLIMLFLYSFQGFATTFTINQVIENNGVFPRQAISTLYRLYIEEVIERHLDSSAYVYR